MYLLDQNQYDFTLHINTNGMGSDKKTYFNSSDFFPIPTNWRFKSDESNMNQNIKGIEFKNNPHPKYAKNYQLALYDNKFGVCGDYQENWIGFQGDTLHVSIQILNSELINSCTLRFCHDPNSWVFAPFKIFYQTSDDNIHFSELTALPLDFEPENQNSTNTQLVTFTIPNPKASIIRVIAVPIVKLPLWHPNAGEKAWMMIDEIMLNQ
jgi:hypothetical protein